MFWLRIAVRKEHIGSSDPASFLLDSRPCWVSISVEGLESGHKTDKQREESIFPGRKDSFPRSAGGAVLRSG